ncbi:MAG: MAPEG family protein [Caulobacteraceae bacterium]|nr:MAPEG family protein [Caulobacteraceae bacterium]
MTLSLWMLLAFAAWTLAVLLVGVGVRRWTLIFKGEASLTSFPGDTAHGAPAYRRAVRAHANCVENLPVFGAIVLVGAVARLSPAGFGALSALVMAGRVLQTTTHALLPETNRTVALRFGFFFLQVLAMIAMSAELAAAAR